MAYLSDQLKQISEELAALSQLASGEHRDAESSIPAEDPIDAAGIRRLIRARRLRAEFFSDDIFPDPAWDMMLDLMAARLEGEKVSVSSLCVASAVPPTTALRWIALLCDRGILERHPDEGDGRRVNVALSQSAADNLQSFFLRARSSLRDPLV